MVTAGHSALVDNLTSEQIIEIKKWNDIKMIDDKFLIPSRVYDYFEPYNTTRIYNVYHLVLDNANKDGQYGIYANNVLLESMSINEYENTSTYGSIENNLNFNKVM